MPGDRPYEFGLTNIVWSTYRRLQKAGRSKEKNTKEGSVYKRGNDLETNYQTQLTIKG